MSITPDPADLPLYQQVAYSESQRLLLAVLEDLKPQLAEIYTSCLHLLQYANVPDHFALAAHQARELIEKIPPALGVAWTDAKGAVAQFDDLINHYGEGVRAIGTSLLLSPPS